MSANVIMKYDGWSHFGNIFGYYKLNGNLGSFRMLGHLFSSFYEKCYFSSVFFIIYTQFCNNFSNRQGYSCPSLRKYAVIVYIPCKGSEKENKDAVYHNCRQLLSLWKICGKA